MANKISYKLPKPSDLDIFSTQADRNAAVRTQVENIPIDLIDGFPDHPYSVRDDEAMALLVESISENGVLNPPLVRSMDNGRYQMVSGHRRMHACILAGIDTIDCKVLTNIDDDKATILMVDSNFQREQLLPSEKAKAYKMRHEAMKRQGKRTDLEGKESYSAADEIAKTAPDSASTVKRYIRLASLLPAFMEMLDSGELTTLAGLELALLPAEDQEIILERISNHHVVPTIEQAKKLRYLHDTDNLNTYTADTVLRPYSFSTNAAASAESVSVPEAPAASVPEKPKSDTPTGPRMLSKEEAERFENEEPTEPQDNEEEAPVESIYVGRRRDPDKEPVSKAPATLVFSEKAIRHMVGDEVEDLYGFVLNAVKAATGAAISYEEDAEILENVPYEFQENGRTRNYILEALRYYNEKRMGDRLREG